MHAQVENYSLCLRELVWGAQCGEASQGWQQPTIIDCGKSFWMVMNSSHCSDERDKGNDFSKGGGYDIGELQRGMNQIERNGSFFSE